MQTTTVQANPTGLSCNSLRVLFLSFSYLLPRLRLKCPPLSNKGIALLGNKDSDYGGETFFECLLRFMSTSYKGCAGGVKMYM